jgi:hypothetical protein
MPSISDDDRQALIDSAQRLQIEPRTLAAVIDYESSFNPRSVSPSGKGYQVRGLIGFDPSNVRRYGMPAATIAEQMPQVERYLLDRGWKPGEHGSNDLGRLYSIINAGSLDKSGNPRWGARDINGSIADHVRNIQARHYAAADRALGGPIANNPMDAIDSALGLNELPEHWAKQESVPDKGDIFSSAGVTFRSPQGNAPAASSGSTKPEGDMFDAAGITFGPSKDATALSAPPPGAPPGAAGAIDMPGIGGRRYVDAQGKPIAQPNAAPSPLESSIAYRGSGAAAHAGAEKLEEAIAKEFTPAAAQAKRGWEDVMSGRTATGLGNVFWGGLGMAGAPVSGVLNAMVAKPVTEYTGSPGLGEAAALAAGGVPALGGARTAAAAVNPANRAVNTLVDAIGPENVPDVAARLRANPQLSLADVSDPVRIMTQGIAADPAQPIAQRVVQDAVKQRVAEVPAQTNSAFTQAMGPAPNVNAMMEGLKQRARDAGRAEIEPALANAKPVDTSPVIKAIDDIVKPGIQAQLDPVTRLPLSDLQQELLRLKQQLVTPTGETLTDPRRLHFVQSDFGDKAYQLQRSAPKDQYLGNQLRNINEKLVDQIDQASGGAYRPARAKFKDAKDIQQAWEEGFDVLKNRSGVQGLEDRPEALADWMKTATPEEKVAKRLAVRSDIDQKINGVRNQGLAGQGITKIDYNRQKLRTLFGDDEANRLIRTMDDAADMSRTNAKLTEGSKTAETLAGREALAVRPVGGGNPLNYIGPVGLEAMNYMGLGGTIPGLGAGAFTAGKLAHMGFQKVGQLSDRARNAAFARAAVARGGERDQVVSALTSHPQVMRELQKRNTP